MIYSTNSIQPTTYEITATAGVTAGTGADTLMTSMTVTPIQGTYLVWFSCDIDSINAGNTVSVSLYTGGVQEADSLRKVIPFCGGTLTSGSARCGLAINARIAVTGAQAIEVRWSASAGTNTVAARNLMLMKVG